MKEPLLSIKIGEKFNVLFSYIDEQGHEMNNSSYHFAKSYNDGNAFVYKNFEWDIIDSKGFSVINSFRHCSIIHLALDNIIPKDYFFLKNYRIGDNLVFSIDFIRLKRKLLKLFPVKYESGRTVHPWKSDFHWNYSPQSLFILNIVKDELCFSFVEDVTLEGDGLIGIKPYNEEWRYITSESFNEHDFNKKAFDCDIEEGFKFSGGLAKVKVNGMYGFIDTSGEFNTPPQYDDARSFYEGYAAVAIANCRLELNKNVKNSIGLKWNFINLFNQNILTEYADNLSNISDGDYYFRNEDYRDVFNCASLDKEKMNNRNIFFYYGSIDSLSSIKSHNSHWAKTNAIGHLSTYYVIDLLTAMGSVYDEIGFKPWFILAKEKSASAFNVIQFTHCKITISTIDIDFDTTQSEMDIIKGMNSLVDKYGNPDTSNSILSDASGFSDEIVYSSDEEENFHLKENDFYETDWTHYDDNLDMDEQSDEFWNQF